MGGAMNGEENPQVIVNFGRGGKSGAGRSASLALLDCEGGRKTLDRIYGGCGQLRKVVSGVGGKALEITALSLGINGVEGERRFSRARGTRKDNQLMARNIE